MPDFSASKVVASLPSTLDANAVYFVRIGAGFDMYVTDATGAIAHQANIRPHNHEMSDIDGLAAALDGKADAVHSHSWNDLTDRPTIPTVVSFATDAEAEAYHTANPTHIVFSREV